jgi:hypothetical protein
VLFLNTDISAKWKILVQKYWPTLHSLSKMPQHSSKQSCFIFTTWASILAEASNPDWGFHSLPQYLQAHYWTVSWNWALPFPTTTQSIHYSQSYWHWLVDSCKYSNEPSSFVRCRELPDYLEGHQLLYKGCVLWVCSYYHLMLYTQQSTVKQAIRLFQLKIKLNKQAYIQSQL